MIENYQRYQDLVSNFDTLEMLNQSMVFSLFTCSSAVSHWLQQSDIEIAAQEIRRMRDELTEIYVKHNSKGKTFDEVNKDIERDNFMTAPEALEYGLIDEIVDKRP